MLNFCYDFTQVEFHIVFAYNNQIIDYKGSLFFESFSKLIYKKMEAIYGIFTYQCF